ncbi:MAG: branched-chain amino acid ABC transporter permease [Candidatus Edwardsbacteria bacterium]|jgi:branched-chain amino acid transport system permease protein|nr:branched-chain amino acid ABC transporter permease [Candidatus Edwardsbacteria bacterium]
MSGRLKYLIWPLWIAVLVWPFTKLRGALIVLAAAAAGSALLFVLRSWAPRIALPAMPRLASFSGHTKTGLLIALVLFSLALPLCLNKYFLDVVVTAGIYVVLALGLNIIVGLAGLLVLGYIAFYAVGAYGYAILSTHFHLNFFWALPIGALLALLAGLLLGLPTLRLRGDYLAIVTLGFGEIMRIVLNNWDGLTGGPNGIMHIGRPAIGALALGRPTHLYYIVLALIALAALLTSRLNRSRLGRALVAMREDETAARACGIDTTRLKVLAFCLSAAVAGLMGVVFAAKMSFVSPESFTFWESVMVLCMVVLGGMASVPGVILGALALIVLPEAFRGLQHYRMLVFGAAMIAMMIFRPQGLLPSRRRTLELGE